MGMKFPIASMGGTKMKKTESITIRLKKELMEYIRNEADRQGISLNACISIILTEAVNGRKENS